MILLLQYTLLYASVLLLVALGGCFSERSGVINLGLEGIMVMGAMGGSLAMRFLYEGAPAAPGYLYFVLAVLASMLTGMLFSLLLAIACIHFRADQTIIGTALNMLATAASVVIIKAINAAGNSGSAVVKYIEPKQHLVFQIGSFRSNWFCVLTVAVLIASYITLYKTRFGLHLMACGEHPQAADSVGIPVHRLRYAGVLISGALGGLGGITYIVAGVSEWKFEGGVMGFGFLALAVMIFGQWKPIRIALAALLFGMCRALSNVYSGIPFLADLHIGSAVYSMMPYIISLLVLAFASKKSRAPKAEGIPYDKGQR